MRLSFCSRKQKLSGSNKEIGTQLLFMGFLNQEDIEIELKVFVMKKGQDMKGRKWLSRNKVCLAVKEFFETGKLLGEVNATLIALIPKKFGFHDMMVKWIMACVSSSKFSICLNGEIHGYFKGGRGLRQGNPISPYLFTLVMEVFSLIMKKNIEQSEEFRYHYGCKELKLSHMCFADDLLVICKGNCGSLKVVKKSLDEFSEISSFRPNMGKSTIFFGCLNDREKGELLDILPFKCGRLPVRYLGVPLLDKKKLGVKDCKVLIDKVILQKGKARVAWKDICKPKEQGGSGIKDIKKWNEVLLIRQFWKIMENKGSLWARWVNVVKLKNKSIWCYNVDKTGGYKAMMGIKYLIKKHIFVEIGDGQRTSMWHDRWCGEGPLHDFISRRSIYDARMDDDITVDKMVINREWKWPD
uniref:uncharacterized protein LOC122583683 n=1 Tax=Erigeron canadensis TaxID=72917 RepID=UPI001CB8BFE5|nr:uncharacterized protein LOC122583683 [Erigeron canadensis]